MNNFLKKMSSLVQVHRLFFSLGIVFLAQSLCFVNLLNALPFNDDMVHDQFKTSEVMRGAPTGSVPVGASSYQFDSVLATKNMTPEGMAARAAVKNPVPASPLSIESGKRLWQTNCSPCHGNYSGKADPQLPSSAYFEKSIDPVVAGPTTGPNLVSEAYVNDPSKHDGHILSYIHFGGLAIMPRYGYKLSPRDHWDIINYIRWMQRDFLSAVLGKSTEDKE